MHRVEPAPEDASRGSTVGAPGVVSRLRPWRWLVAIGVALAASSGCSLIISNELDGKSNAAGSGGSSPDGGHDAGPDAPSSDASDASEASDASDAGEDAGDAGEDANVDAGVDASDGAPPACTSDAECTTPGLPYCDVTSGQCVQCLTDLGCAQGQHCIPAMTCAEGCGTAADCTSPPNATATCSGGACIIGGCAPGFADCDGNASNGCEAELATDPSDCGACGNSCVFLNVANATCVAGACVIGTCSAGFKDCDGIVDNGCEVDTATDVDNCGSCKNECSLPNAVPDCVNSQCGILNCANGFKDCDGVAADGCEVAYFTDVMNCGACGNECNLLDATSTCTDGVCQIARCNAGFADCNGLAADGCEVDIGSNNLNCGACGATCSSTHGTPSCSKGTCTIACTAPYADCDMNVADGCEANTSSSVANCGRCGNVCPNGAGTASCTTGTCTVNLCTPGTGDCSGAGCVDPLTSLENCGGCGVACATPNANPTCSSGVCAILSCNAGFADCNNLAVDGCEVNLNTSLPNCGGCGQACKLPNATTVCNTGSCAINACAQGYADCDMSAADGCEVNTSTDARNCGACGNACGSLNGTPKCTAGACSITCSPGFADCDGNTKTGCETNLNTDPSHCGGCSTACSLPHATAACSNGTCAVGSCDTGYADCDGNPANGCEVNLTTDPANCSACGMACSSENGKATCSGSTCGIVCSPGYGNCNGSLADGCEAVLASDVNNCGACKDVCPSTNGTPKCVSGTCGFASCNSGYGDCSGGGCMTLETDPMNCGSCGTVCAAANASVKCTGGTCAVAACNTGFADCDGVYANGCETNLSTLSNCGSCNTPCSLPHAQASCTSGSCELVNCIGSFANCDGDPSNGCEVNVATDVGNCGSCKNACSTVNATPSCSAGSCSLKCATGFGDCDQNVATGCEATLATDPLNCGACARPCATTNVAAVDCSGGVCDSSCVPGFGNCTEPTTGPDDGCESSVSSNALECGSCANSCGQLECSPGQATPGICGCGADAECNVGQAMGSCGDGGTCQCSGVGCNPGELCVNDGGADGCSCNGSAPCTAPQICCGTPAGCFDPTQDPSNCGGCGHACPAGFACQASACVCTADANCNAGGTCHQGVCTCGTTPCAPGQRCLANGSCG